MASNQLHSRPCLMIFKGGFYYLDWMSGLPDLGRECIIYLWQEHLKASRDPSVANLFSQSSRHCRKDKYSTMSPKPSKIEKFLILDQNNSTFCLTYPSIYLISLILHMITSTTKPTSTLLTLKPYP